MAEAKKDLTVHREIMGAAKIPIREFETADEYFARAKEALEQEPDKYDALSDDACDLLDDDGAGDLDDADWETLKNESGVGITPMTAADEPVPEPTATADAEPSPARAPSEGEQESAAGLRDIAAQQVLGEKVTPQDALEGVREAVEKAAEDEKKE